MSWATVREATRLALAKALLLEDVVGLDAVVQRRVEWENRATAERVVGDTWCDLRFGVPSGIGTDEVRYCMSPDNLRLVPTYGGLRRFTVQVLLSSYSQEPDADAVGFLAGRMRTRLRRNDVLDVLREGSVALIRIHPTINVDYQNQEARMVSASSTDIVFSCFESDTDPDEDVGWIDAVGLQGTLATGHDEVDIVEDIEIGTIT